MNQRRVVITGVGMVTPLGLDTPSTWANLLSGRSAARQVTHFDTSLFKTHFGCEVEGFDVSYLLDRKEARKYDRYAQLGLAAAEEAFHDAALDMSKEDPYRVGVIFGSGMGGLRTLEDEVAAFATSDGVPRFNPFMIPKAITSIGAGLLAIRYGMKGVNFATTSACASSAHAIANAFCQVRLGMADVMMAGGSEAAVEVTGIGGFNALHALSTRNEDVEHACRPFSASRDGFVLGEGAGCLILEEMEHAVRRGATIYAEIVGAGMTADAYHITAPDPNGDGAAHAMSSAIEQAGIKRTDIDYINTHGTSTPLGDLSETHAIQSVFGDYAGQINLSSSKSMTGHLLGGAGAVETIITILSMQYSIVTPTINHADGDDDPAMAGLNFTFNQAQSRTINYALSNAFGFGGQNASILFKKL